METPEPVLPLSLVIRDQFLGLFYEPVDFRLQAKTSLHLHVLRVDGGDFAVGVLYKTLANLSLSYVLSRQNFDRFKSDLGREVEWVNKVQSQFKKPDRKAGEGGEVLLYSFLEAHLGAPKILSKMELKTSSEHYVHGADGVHLLQSGENEYQLIFGESKMYADVKRAIKAAFESMGKVREDDFKFDTWLVESELLKESLDTDKVAVLESILLPSAGGQDPIKKSNAFGVFIGFEIDGTRLKPEEMGTSEIEVSLRQMAKAVIEAQLESIRSEIMGRGLGGYHFHIYAVPFMRKTVNGKTQGIENVRFDLAAALGNYSGSKK